MTALYEPLKVSDSLLSLDAVLASVRGTCAFGAGAFGFTSVCIDSRAASDTSLFVALNGQERNGHDYIPQALENGASVIFASKADYAARQEWYKKLFAQYPGSYCILADNTLEAFQNAAETYVAQYPAILKTGISGSSGKTSTKQVAYNVLSQKYNTVCNEGNLNTETGLPLSVFKIKNEHEAGVFELGMNRQGEITEIARVLKPKYAIITNIGTAHVGLLGSVDAIAYEKKQIFNNFTDDCVAIIPKDDPYADFLRKDIRGTVLYYSDTDEGLKELGIEQVRAKGIDGTEFYFEGERVTFALAGRYNLKNLLSVITLARVLNLSHEQIVRGIASATPYFGRSEVLRGDITIIHDCYNANPSSMAAALDFYAELSVSGKKIAVLGDMFELGKDSSRLHEEVVAHALHSGVNNLLLIGKDMADAFAATKNAAGASRKVDVTVFDSWDDDHILCAANKILSLAAKGDTVFIKGSRSTGLERITQKLCANKGAA
jgi:UDP-N-acetylmuramoyl-tripeptide--D-alanyl-D-alanine ligase